MPIVLVHGVAVRSSAYWPGVDTFLRRFVAPVIADDPKGVPILRAYWGDLAASFAWDGISRPLTQLLGQGATGQAQPAERAIVAADLGPALGAAPRVESPRPEAGGQLSSGRVTHGASRPAPALRPRDLPPEQLSDLLATVIANTRLAGEDQGLAAIAADAVAHDPATRAELDTSSSKDEDMLVLRRRLQAEIQQEYQEGGPLVGMGPLDRIGQIVERLDEALDRGGDLPGAVATRVLAEFRSPINELATTFIGDVLTYLRGRGDTGNPGPIPARVVETLVAAREAQHRRNGEPIIVLSHSMGGQIIYDLITAFIPGMADLHDVRIDFWCATASQVGLFEELKLFLASSPDYGKAKGNQVPFPPRERLGVWWNVWDHNDFISYRADKIIDGVIDESYNSGMGLVAAHSGYVQRPSFFRTFASKLRQAKESDWRRA
jgi:hypothetical protein